MKRRSILIGLAALAGIVIYIATRPPGEIVLTGIVTTDQVIVGSEIQGRVEQLKVREGDCVKQGDLLALIQPKEAQADVAYYSSTEEQSISQVAQAEAELKFQELQTSNQIQQAEANLASSEALTAQAAADLENAKLDFKREEALFHTGVDTEQAFDQARNTRDSVQARVESLRKQARAAESAVALAKSNAEQIAARKAALEASHHQRDASTAQKEKARVRLGYAEIRAPMDGIVNVRGALQGEVVTPGQGVVTLINPDDLWVRVDVEESYIEQVQVGDKMKVRLPSGAEREGTVFFQKAVADYATQRDVNRSKRDIKTFEFRLRCDNKDRKLALGMTAYVPLTVKK